MDAEHETNVDGIPLNSSLSSLSLALQKLSMPAPSRPGTSMGFHPEAATTSDGQSTARPTYARPPASQPHPHTSQPQSHPRPNSAAAGPDAEACYVCSSHHYHGHLPVEGSPVKGGAEPESGVGEEKEEAVNEEGASIIAQAVERERADADRSTRADPAGPLAEPIVGEEEGVVDTSMPPPPLPHKVSTYRRARGGGTRGGMTRTRVCERTGKDCETADKQAGPRACNRTGERMGGRASGWPC
ncbi:uncharacterized protein B0H18DRAFT_123159 [Fomitopsis serialis]|uniref:uncharacterized protein n=1 Tax=Fomitopsis serialis TaxID=139415 RepID=UPI00200777AA|nr:uncharacterized protein B0H18DRAFT_123159 [Neoantrodia serialis]KAH9914689.1 hypothetical protein B0H18DRAFT_123159 [Neoantrodia serialis]